MGKKFNVGDRIVCNGFLGQVISVDDSFAEEDESYYDVEWDDGEIETVKESDIEPIDSRGAFLSELKTLLDKYNAKIAVDFNQSYEIYTTTIAFGEDSVKYSYTDGIDCDNIMDYDKE